MSRMWPSVRPCADVSGCRGARCPGHMRAAARAALISGSCAARLPPLLCALFCSALRCWAGTLHLTDAI